MAIDQYGGEERRDERGTARQTDGFTVSPKWWLDGNTMKWIVLNVCTVGLLTICTLGLSLYPIVKAYLRRNRVRYVLDGDRLRLIDEGTMLSSSSTEQIPARDIRDIQTSASPFERRAGVGTVSFREHDGQDTEVTLSGIPRHEELARKLGELQDTTAKETRYR